MFVQDLDLEQLSEPVPDVVSGPVSECSVFVFVLHQDVVSQQDRPEGSRRCPGSPRLSYCQTPSVGVVQKQVWSSGFGWFWLWPVLRLQVSGSGWLGDTGPLG